MNTICSAVYPENSDIMKREKTAQRPCSMFRPNGRGKEAKNRQNTPPKGVKLIKCDIKKEVD